MHLSAYASTFCFTLALLAGCGDDKGGTITTDDDLSGPGSTSTTSETTNPTTDPTTSTTGTTGTTGDTGTSLASDTTLADTTGTTGTTTGDTGTTTTGDTTGASTTGGGGLGEGEICQDNPDGCAPGLLCCYPCGIPDCMNKCIKPDPNTQMCPLFP